jgi:predicted TIM-barrel fold metal-dependent hydrolase
MLAEEVSRPVIVDIHAHYHPRRYMDGVAQLTGRPVGIMAPHPDTDDEDHIAARLQQMDEAGVALQVLSPAAGRVPYARDEAGAVEVARLGNDAYAALERSHPGKFKSFATLPLPHVGASLRELQRCMDDLGMVGANMHITALERSLAEDEFLPIYEELNRRKGILFFHPFGNGILSPLINDYGFSAAVGTSLEDTVIGLHLIAKNIPATYPDITYVIPHFGGILPNLLDRLDHQFPMDRNNLAEPPSVTARRFYYDIVGHSSRPALHCATMAFGADHVCCGSDYPVLLSWEPYAENFSWIRRAGLPDADVDQILNRTSQQLLGMEL